MDAKEKPTAKLARGQACSIDDWVMILSPDQLSTKLEEEERKQLLKIISKHGKGPFRVKNIILPDEANPDQASLDLEINPEQTLPVQARVLESWIAHHNTWFQLRFWIEANEANIASKFPEEVDCSQEIAGIMDSLESLLVIAKNKLQKTSALMGDHIKDQGDTVANAMQPCEDLYRDLPELMQSIGYKSLSDRKFARVYFRTHEGKRWLHVEGGWCFVPIAPKK